MVSEIPHTEDRSKTRVVFGRALAALVAAQANWSVLSEVQGAEREAIESWAAKAKVDLDKPNAKARSKLLDVANNALVSVALGSMHPKSEDKLGDLGILNPASYELEIQNPLKTDLAFHGVTKHEIMQTVHFPDSYQHLSPPPEFNPESPLISIFVKVLNRDEITQGGQPTWCLAVGRRAGRKVVIHDAYRIERKTLGDVGTTPLDLLRAFCEVYGRELIAGDNKIGKFLVYQYVQGTATLQSGGPQNHRVKMSTMAKAAPNGGVELAFGYAIDQTLYGNALKA